MMMTSNNKITDISAWLLRMIATLLLFSSCFIVFCDADTGDPSMKEFFRVTFGFKEWYSKKSQEPQPIHVMSAGLPRTGTASFVVALSKLGLKSYHMKDGAVETPGHLDMWYDLYSSSGTTTLDKLFDDMSVHGFNATSDAPVCFWYQEQMKRYPNAKVVLTVRGGNGDDNSGGEAWSKSFQTAIIDVMSIMSEVPFRWIPMFPKIELMVQQMLPRALEIDIDPKTHYPIVDQLPQAYDKWNSKVKATVPSSNLLVFAPQDGWEPLYTFLKDVSPEVANRCGIILASGEPYLNVND